MLPYYPLASGLLTGKYKKGAPKPQGSRFDGESKVIALMGEKATADARIETVERLTPVVRSRAKYQTSLQVLRRAKELSSRNGGIVTKSGVMLGLGEKETELFQTMDDLREVGCEVLTIGQYLRPSPKHLPVVEYITPEQFDYYGNIARGKGFLYVASGPLVRSSYHAADFHPVVRR